MPTILHQVNHLQKAYILKRPSATIKSPFVADIILDGDKSKTVYLAHTPSLGCNGLCDLMSTVYVAPIQSPKCQYRVYLAQFRDRGHTIRIGVEPKMAEKIAYQALERGLFSDFKIKTLKSEQQILRSRFDFVGTTQQDQSFICEVKNVSLADYDDVTKKERQKLDFSHLLYDQKLAYFPDGYRKQASDPVSCRSIKQLEDLMEIRRTQPETRCIILYIIQRQDVNRFQPSRLDPIYVDKLQQAVKCGVELKALQVKWSRNKAYLITAKLPINFTPFHT